MKILITGANGVVGKFLSVKLKDHDVYIPKRSCVDFTNKEHVDTLFNSHGRFDLVLHCAVRGGNRLYHDSWDVLDDNLRMYYNILHHKNSYNKFITFGSGAEMYMSDSPYGLSKRVITKSMIDQFNFYNIRIFGLFGEGEIETRFIRSALTKYVNNEPIDIHENKYMDFFYMEDLWTLVKYYIDTDNPPKEVDCCYGHDMMSLKKIAKIINTLGDYEVPINDSSSYPISYTGKKKVINSLPIELIGLEKGLKLEYEKYKLCN
jgi:nucleoside-diphosphate-sugar epimerase